MNCASFWTVTSLKSQKSLKHPVAISCGNLERWRRKSLYRSVVQTKWERKRVKRNLKVDFCNAISDRDHLMQISHQKGNKTTKRALRRRLFDFHPSSVRPSLAGKLELKPSVSAPFFVLREGEIAVTVRFCLDRLDRCDKRATCAHVEN